MHLGNCQNGILSFNKIKTTGVYELKVNEVISCSLDTDTIEDGNLGS